MQGPLKGPGLFWVFNAQIYTFPHILETIFLSFWHLFQHQKLIQIEDYIVLQSIWDIFVLLHTFAFFNLHEKVLPLII